MLEELLLNLTGGVRGRDEWITWYTRRINRDWTPRSHVSPTHSTLCFFLNTTKGECVPWFEEWLSNSSCSPLQISFASFSRLARLKLLATIVIRCRLDLNAHLFMPKGIFYVLTATLVQSLLLFSHLALHGECIRYLFKCYLSWPVHFDTKKKWTSFFCLENSRLFCHDVQHCVIAHALIDERYVDSGR